jgi:anti-anti-sigma regulatory factor
VTGRVTAAVSSTRLGERTCVVAVPAGLDAAAARRLEDGVNAALDDGCRDFVLDFTAVRRCQDRHPTAVLVRVAHRLTAMGCEVFVAARHLDLLAFFGSVPSWSKLPVALERDEALALLLERPA